MVMGINATFQPDRRTPTPGVPERACHPERQRGIPLESTACVPSKGILRRARPVFRFDNSGQRPPRAPQDDMPSPDARLLRGCAFDLVAQDSTPESVTAENHTWA